jgi:alkylhydroperoxidase/carboxymuconolactone decarboxylase family protein YurZ
MGLDNYYGIDLRDLDTTTPAQADGLRRYYRDAKDTVMPEYEFWLEHRPDVAKRRILFVMMCRSEEAREFMLPSLTGWIAYYLLTDYPEGVVYQIANASKVGASKELVLDACAVAQLYADLHGLSVALTPEVTAALQGYQEIPRAQIFPTGWARDEPALRSGLDFSSPEMTHDEGRMLERWWQDAIGEVPDYVERMLVSCPDLLKAQRRRWETATRVAPLQVLPYLMIHLGLLLGHVESLREAFMLARWSGMTRDQLMDGVGRMVSYGGMSAVSTAVEVAGDVFDSYA